MVHPSLVLKIQKLDKRYTGGDKFSYCIDFNYKDGELFCDIRAWCWETWGPSCEFKFVRDNNPEWCWISDTYRNRLYFKGTAEINWYKLRWE
jgi:hypothetical protein